MEFLSEKALRHTNTTYFVLPVLEIPPYLLEEEGCIDAYLFLIKDGIINTDVNNIYLLTSKKPSDVLLKHQRYVSDFEIRQAVTHQIKKEDYLNYRPVSLDDGKWVVVFGLMEEEVTGLVAPLLEGKFSKISKEIREKYFPLDPTHPYYIHRLIIERSPQVKTFIERDLSETICPECELWTGFIKEKETLEVRSL